jgi:ABC-type lipoprotein export system ATPase subunit/cell division protein FtsX
MIKVLHLDKYFNRHQKNEIHVLNDITLEFPQKGLVILLGASGSGKTTLLNVIGGLDKVQGGIIDFGGEVIKDYDANTWDQIRNESVGYIFQNYNLLPELSVFDNVAFVLKMIGINHPEIIEKRVNYILSAVGMYPYRKKKALQLSGGQQQRVAIARALVKNPKVIIADEPTGNLDSKNTIDVMNIIKEISKEKLVLLVTHEKDIAKFYGDRIIEIKDGQVIDDYTNVLGDDHSIDKDDTIYLKDLTQVSAQSDGKLSTAFYTDHEEGEEPVTIRLIVKNKTLYIDMDTAYQKIKLVDKSSNVVIKDEHYQKKTREEITQTAFDLSILDNKDVKRDSAMMVNIKQSLMMALRKVLKASAKAKLMLASFLIAGVVIAIAIATLAAVAIVRPEIYMTLPKGYVNVQQTGTLWTYSQVMALNEDDDPKFYVNPYGNVTFEFMRASNDSPVAMFNAPIESVNHVSANQLVLGRMPTNRYEILISEAMAEILVETKTGQDAGIWSYQHIFYERFKFGNVTFKIVGIVESKVKLAYMAEDTALFIYNIATSGYHGSIPYTFVDSSFLTHGVMPSQDGEVVVSRQTYVQLFGGQPAGTFPKAWNAFNFQIVGVYDMPTPIANVLMTVNDNKKMTIAASPNLNFYVTDSIAFADRLDGMPNVEAFDIYQQAYNAITRDQTVVLLSTLSASGILLGLATLGFYFVIRSSLFQRIYEVSVYRALGVRKVDVFRSFIVEIFVLTTLTTLVGFVLANIALGRLQEGLLGQLNFFYVNPLTFVIGLILLYAINLGAGLFPVAMLLKKTPAQILSQYDI